MATISDVARLAGVATSTVSHVLNGTRFVSAETAHAVKEAVRAVGYTPNTLARALARSTTNTIGLAMSATRNRYFADVINAIEEECSDLGMMVLLANTHDDPVRESEVVAALHQRRVDGIIIAPSCDPASHALDYLREKRVPTVMVDRLPDVALDGVGVENRKAIGTMVDHLVGHGHGQIGLLTGQAHFTTAQERAAGFRDALVRHGLPVTESHISMGLTDLDAARQAAVEMLRRGVAPSAMIGGNNLTTIGIMLAARDLGRAVPDDLAVIGFDDFDWAIAFRPQLTTMVQPCQMIGHTAANLLKRRIGMPESAPEIIHLEPTLTIRHSCGCSREAAASHGKAARRVVAKDG